MGTVTCASRTLRSPKGLIAFVCRRRGAERLSSYTERPVRGDFPVELSLKGRFICVRVRIRVEGNSIIPFFLTNRGETSARFNIT